MKKMMVALVGSIVSVLMLASCYMEVDNDVSLEKTDNQYRMVVTGSASYILAEENPTTKKWEAKKDVEKVELVVNSGWIGWNHNRNTNQKEYNINAWYAGDTEKEKLDLEEFYGKVNRESLSLFEYQGEFYLNDVYSDGKVTVTESPEDDSFSVKASNLHVSRYGDDVLLTFDLTFTR